MGWGSRTIKPSPPIGESIEQAGNTMAKTKSGGGGGGDGGGFCVCL